MNTFLPGTLRTALVLGLLAAFAGQPGNDASLRAANLAVSAPKDPAPKKTMRAFASEQELTAYFKELAEKQRRGSLGVSATSETVEVTAASPGVNSANAYADSVTNVQHAGVDEGGIVKVHGNHLVVLRRGRLFTVAIGDNALEPISNIDAFGPDIDPNGTWYDEMLVSQDNIAVIGYSYQRGGTEIGLFKIDSKGKLSYRSTYHLRSNDYYSSRNYASRLIGTKLIFYTPLYFYPGADPVASFPAVRKWHKGATESEFRRIISANHIYRAEYPLQGNYGLALHTVTVCDLAHDDFDCQATSVVGPWGRVFYVSPEAVYVWVNDWARQGDKTHIESMVYRMPLSADAGSAPSALRVSGSPVDQFSFLESEDGRLNVLVRSDAVGDGMWGPEVAAGDVALLSVRLEDFSDGNERAPASSYRRLPKPEGYTFQNQFVGDYLLYGTGSGWGYPQNAKESILYAVPWSGGEIHNLSLTHGVDRIEQMGSDAVIVGTDGRNLHFTSLRLGPWPEIADEYVRKDASQGELRSHGFFYKPDSYDSGMLGLPISLPGRAGYRHLFENSAAILFLKSDHLHFEQAGELEAQFEGTKDDGCRASCVDWYGNARPLFVRGRVIALLGYELVEGKVKNGRIHEMRRVSYAPISLAASR
jgi:hypothetical protein